jgi:hypothetical protein
MPRMRGVSDMKNVMTGIVVLVATAGVAGGCSASGGNSTGSTDGGDTQDSATGDGAGSSSGSDYGSSSGNDSGSSSGAAPSSSSGIDAASDATPDSGAGTDSGNDDGGDAAAGCAPNLSACSNGGAQGLCENALCGTCTDLTDDSTCTSAYGGATTPYLCLSGACAPGDCRQSSDCTDNSNGPTCGAMIANLCGKCANDSQCAGTAATPVCDTATGGCVAGTCTGTGANPPIACPVNASDICCTTACASFTGTHPCCPGAASTAYCTTSLGVGAQCVNNVCTSCPPVTNGQYTVDPNNGSDASGTGAGGGTGGTCAFKTITHALAVLASNTAPMPTITVVGPSTVSAGETFPLGATNVSITTSGGPVTVVVPATKNGISLTNGSLSGTPAAPLSISGTATAGNGILVSGGQCAISNLTVQNFGSATAAGAGITVISPSTGSTSIGQGVISTKNANGMTVTGDGPVIINVPLGGTPTQFNGNARMGIEAGSAEGSITITGTPGADGAGTVQTNQNGYGLYFEQSFKSLTVSTITGLDSWENAVDGMLVSTRSTVKVRGSAFLANGKNGVEVQVYYLQSEPVPSGPVPPTYIDLGTALDGNNTLQAALNLNGGVGLCFDAPGTLAAEGNIFGEGSCVTQAVTLVRNDLCTGGADVGIVGTWGATATIDASQCTIGTYCAKKTCAEQHIQCGPASDGCGGSLSCGGCYPGLCGGGGVPGQCG